MLRIQSAAWENRFCGMRYIARVACVRRFLFLNTFPNACYCLVSCFWELPLRDRISPEVACYANNSIPTRVMIFPADTSVCSMIPLLVACDFLSRSPLSWRNGRTCFASTHADLTPTLSKLSVLTQIQVALPYNGIEASLQPDLCVTFGYPLGRGT